MGTAMKHVGSVGEKPCVVLFREVPNEPENCLVVKTTTLTDQQHDALMNVIQSAEAQEASDISEVLHRRQFPDGTNMLSTLHQNKKIEKVSVSLVSLTPTPATKVPLADVNAEIRKIQNKSNPPLKTEMDANTVVETDPTLAQQEQTRIVEEANAAEVGTDEGVAENLLMQAAMIEDDAKALLADAEAKRAEAYRLNPELEPRRGPGRPPKKDIA